MLILRLFVTCVFVLWIILHVNIFLSLKIRERKVKTLTRNWRDHCRTGTTTRKLYRKFRQARPFLSIRREQMFVNTRQMWCHLCRVFTNVCSLLIDKDGRACRNILIQFLCACPTVITSISGKSFHFPLFCNFLILTHSMAQQPLKSFDHPLMKVFFI